jgi:hypothetical protein
MIKGKVVAIYHRDERLFGLMPRYAVTFSTTILIAE